jgi:DNA-binding NarL/FixJ family response regulator
VATAAFEPILLKSSARQPHPVARLVLGDEMVLVREGLASFCQTAARCEVVGQCSDGITALQLIRDLNPDAAFLDWNLPDLFPLEVARQVRSEGLSTKVAVLSTRSDRKTIAEALRSGVSAYVLKSGSSQQIVDAVTQMMAGEVYVSPVLKFDSAAYTPRKGEPVDAFEALSPREYQVFSLLVDGLRAKEIAARLQLSPKTVDTYRASLMQKLEIFDVAGLVKFAIQRSLISSR